MGSQPTVRKFIRGEISPRLTTLYSQMGFVNRNGLAEALRQIDTPDTGATLDALKQKGILKGRFAPASVRDIEPHMIRMTTVSQVEEILAASASTISNTQKISEIFRSLGIVAGMSVSEEAPYESTARIFPWAKDAIRNISASGVYKNFTLGAASLLISGCTGKGFTHEGLSKLIELSYGTHPALTLLAVSFMGTLLPKTGHIRSIVTGGALFGAAIFGVAGTVSLPIVIASAATVTAILAVDKYFNDQKEHADIHNFQRMPYSNERNIYPKQNLDAKISVWRKSYGLLKDFVWNGGRRVGLGALVKFPAEVMHDIWNMSDVNPAKANTARIVYNGTLAFGAFFQACTAAILGVQYLQDVSTIGFIANSLATVAFIVGFGPRGVTSGFFLRDVRHANTTTLADVSPKNEEDRNRAVGLHPEERKFLPYGEGHKNANLKVSAYEEGAPDSPTRKLIKKVLKALNLGQGREREQNNGRNGNGNGQGQQQPVVRDVRPEDLKKTYGMIGRGVWSAFLLIGRERDYYLGIGREMNQPARISENISERLNYKETIDQVMDWVRALRTDVMRANRDITSLRLTTERVLAKFREQAEIWRELTRRKNAEGKEYFALDADMVRQWDGHVRLWEAELERVRNMEAANLPAAELQAKVNDAFDYMDKIFSFDAYMAPIFEWNKVQIGNYKTIRKHIISKLGMSGIKETDTLGRDVTQRWNIESLRSGLQDSITDALADLGLAERGKKMGPNLESLLQAAQSGGWTVEEFLNKVSFEIAAQNVATVGRKPGIESRAHKRFEGTFVVVESMFTEDYQNPFITREPDYQLDDMKARRKQRGHWKTARVSAMAGHPDVKKTTSDGRNMTSISLKRYIEVSADDWLTLSKLYLSPAERARLETVRGNAEQRSNVTMNDLVSEASSQAVINAVIEAAGLDSNNVADRRKMISLERLRRELVKAVSVKGQIVPNSELMEQALITAVSSREIEWFPWATKDKIDQMIRVSHMDKDYIWWSIDPETGRPRNIFTEANPVLDGYIENGETQITQAQLNQENAGSSHVGVEAKAGEDYPETAVPTAKEMMIYRYEKDKLGHTYSNRVLIFYHGAFRYYDFMDRDAISLGQNADQAPWYGGYPFPLSRRTMRLLDEIHVRNQYLQDQPGPVIRFVSAEDALDILLADKKLKALYEGTYHTSINFLKVAVAAKMGNKLQEKFTDDLGREIMGWITENMKEACIGTGIMPGRDKIDHAAFCCGTPRVMDITHMMLAINDDLIQDVDGNVIGKVYTAYDKSLQYTGKNELYGYDARWMVHGGKEENVHLAHQVHEKLKLTETPALLKGNLTYEDILELAERAGYSPEYAELAWKLMREKDSIVDHYLHKNCRVEFSGDSEVLVYDHSGKLVHKFYWYHPEKPVNKDEPKSDPSRDTLTEGLGLVFMDFSGDTKTVRQFLPKKGTVYSYQDLPQADHYRTTLTEIKRTATYRMKSDFLQKGLANQILTRKVQSIKINGIALPNNVLQDLIAQVLRHKKIDLKGMMTSIGRVYNPKETVNVTVEAILPDVKVEYIPPAGGELALEIPTIPETMPYDSITEDKYSTEKGERKGLEIRTINVKVGRGEGPLTPGEVTDIQQPRWYIGGEHSSILEFPFLGKYPSLTLSPKGGRRISSIFWYPHGWSDHHGFRNLAVAYVLGALILQYGLVPMFPGSWYLFTLGAYIGTGLYMYGKVVSDMLAEFRRHPLTDVGDKEGFTKMNGPAFDTGTKPAFMMSGLPFKPTVHTGTKRDELPMKDVEGGLKRMRVSGTVIVAAAAYFTLDTLSLGAGSAILLAGSLIAGGFSALDLYLIRRFLNRYCGDLVKLGMNRSDFGVNGSVIFDALVKAGYINDKGEIQEKFDGIRANFSLGQLCSTAQQNRIFEEIKKRHNVWVHVPGTEYFGLRHVLPFQASLGKLPLIGGYFGEASDLGIDKRIKVVNAIREASVRVEDKDVKTLSEKREALARRVNDTKLLLNRLIYGNEEGLPESELLGQIKNLLPELIKDRRDFSTKVTSEPARAAIFKALGSLADLEKGLAKPGSNTKIMAWMLQSAVDTLRADKALRAEVVRLVGEKRSELINGQYVFVEKKGEIDILRDEVNERIKVKAEEIFRKNSSNTIVRRFIKKARELKDKLRRRKMELMMDIRDLFSKDTQARAQAREEARIAFEIRLMKEERRRRGIY